MVVGWRSAFGGCDCFFAWMETVETKGIEKRARSRTRKSRGREMGKVHHIAVRLWRMSGQVVAASYLGGSIITFLTQFRWNLLEVNPTSEYLMPSVTQP